MEPFEGPFTLAIDIGGTGVKAMVLDGQGEPTSRRKKIPTPAPATPKAVLKVIEELLTYQPAFDRVSAGFPGVIRNGKTLTAHNLDSSWVGFDFRKALEDLVHKPVRVANDADIQGFGAVSGQGVELVLTLGTGLGSALFVDGILVPNLEMGHHPFRKDKSYEDYLGKAALEEHGEKKWQKHLERAIGTLREAFNFERLYLGGGNSTKLDKDSLPDDVHLVPNIAGILGGIALWSGVPGTSLHRAPNAVGASSELPLKYLRQTATTHNG